MFQRYSLGINRIKLKPFCERAEHSKYFTAEISFAIASPCKLVCSIKFFN